MADILCKSGVDLRAWKRIKTPILYFNKVDVSVGRTMRLEHRENGKENGAPLCKIESGKSTGSVELNDLLISMMTSFGSYYYGDVMECF